MDELYILLSQGPTLSPDSRSHRGLGTAHTHSCARNSDSAAAVFAVWLGFGLMRSPKALFVFCDAPLGARMDFVYI
ncbi:hypothetical protein BOTBODRAFT_26191 [Botryobasidium botryosum FD-172 SS1]|uniref:Uncharacterized protein n=1 Tax=Botryobasidium botryosum (strain FD-172 SS1) TaxID=930990 RepID=A0A067N186_BOTB1|nr:hypothetical protein BOTBODRAFT_26191 [Botryobasidium botryosum FD-172 SS1]